MKPASTRTATVPRYQRIAGELEAAISAGRYALGDELPTEWDLSQAHSVSRATAREALRRLQQEGYIARKRGAASRVIATHPSSQYSVALSTEEDILRYAGTTILQLRPQRGPVPRKRLAELHLDEGAPWRSASGVRWSSPTAPPIAATTVLVPDRYAGVIEGLRGPITGALFARICAEFRLHLASIEQTITAVPLPRANAAELTADAGSPALRIVRRFSAAKVGLFEVSVSIHPADRFAYTVRFERVLRRPAR